MPTISNSISVAANAVSANVLAGELFEFMQNQGRVQVFLAGSAAGLNGTMAIGGEIVANEISLNAQNRVPVVPDDISIEFDAVPGERLFLTFRNTTGGALTAFYTVSIS